MMVAEETPGRSPITVLVVSHQFLFREGLVGLLRTQPDFLIADVLARGMDALKAAAAHQPRVVIIDADLPHDALDHLLQSLPGVAPRSRPILLHRGMAHPQAVEAIQRGVRGLVTTSAQPASVFKCIRAVHAGEYWVSRALVSALAGVVADSRGSTTAPRPFNLTARERQVLELVAEGLANKGVAQELSLSVETVKHHLTSIFNKTGVGSRLELAMFAAAHGLRKSVPS